MKASTINRSRGASNIAKGKVKEVAGKATGARRLQAKGKAQKEVGKVQRAVGNRQKVRGA